MRAKIVISLFIFLVSVSFLVINSSRKETNTISTQTQFTRPDSFYIGAIDNGWAFSDYDWLKELNLNIWHKYPLFNEGWYPIIQRDLLFDDSVNYFSNVLNKILDVKSNHFNIVMDRAKMTYLTYGRCSDYKASINLQQDSLYWSYRYKCHLSDVSGEEWDNTSYGNGIWVRKCSTLVNNAGYVFDSLISNREQIYNSENNLLSIDQRFWHIIPRIRINPDYANNPNLDTTRIFRIEVLKFDGTIKDSVTIKAKYFKKDLPGQIYDGSYREHYYFPPSFQNSFVRDTALIIESSFALNPDNKSYVDSTCKVDYKIYWYGECDMWVDRIHVCNQIAFDLFDSTSNNTQHTIYIDWIRWETQLGMTDNAGWRFACDEPEFSKLPVLKYLNEKIMAQSGGKLGMTPLVNYDNLRTHLPTYYLNTHFTPERLKKYLVDIGGFREYYFDVYPIRYGIDLPYKINNVSLSLNESNGILGTSASTMENYDSAINTILDRPNFMFAEGTFSKDLKRGLELSKLTGIPVYPVLQAHLYYKNML